MVASAQDALILLVHPLAALAVIYLMYDQHRWRKQRLELRGEERLAARATHEQRGERLFQAAVAVVLLGFAVSLFRGLSAGETLFWALLGAASQPLPRLPRPTRARPVRIPAPQGADGP